MQTRQKCFYRRNYMTFVCRLNYVFFIFADFATGTSLHSDILCSLCKRTRDVMCTMRLCVDPERGQNAVDSGVQCVQGFCRWQKEAVVNTGFNNYYHAWWQPQNLYFFFDHVTKEIATAYDEFIASTSKAIHGLGWKTFRDDFILLIQTCAFHKSVFLIISEYFKRIYLSNKIYNGNSCNIWHGLVTHKHGYLRNTSSFLIVLRKKLTIVWNRYRLCKFLLKSKYLMIFMLWNDKTSI